MKQMWIGRLALASVLAFGGTMATADAIDGDWCSPGQIRSMRIDGPRILTPGRQLAEGTYSRHAFQYIVPEGESDAGLGVDMQLLSDNDVLVSVGDGEPETWHRCDLNV